MPCRTPLDSTSLRLLSNRLDRVWWEGVGHGPNLEHDYPAYPGRLEGTVHELAHIVVADWGLRPALRHKISEYGIDLDSTGNFVNDISAGRRGIAAQARNELKTLAIEGLVLINLLPDFDLQRVVVHAVRRGNIPGTDGRSDGEAWAWDRVLWYQRRPINWKRARALRRYLLEELREARARAGIPDHVKQMKRAAKKALNKMQNTYLALLLLAFTGTAGCDPCRRNPNLAGCEDDPVLHDAGLLCGGQSQPCCGGTACNTALTCQNGLCLHVCGGLNQPCCDLDTCNGILGCSPSTHTCVTPSNPGLPPGSRGNCGCWGTVQPGLCYTVEACASNIGCPDPSLCSGFCGGGGVPYQFVCQ